MAKTKKLAKVKIKDNKKKPIVKKTKKTEQTKKKIQPSQKTPVKAKIQKPERQPQTMEELLDQTGYQIRGLRKGEEVEGILREIGKNKLLIDIGAKTEGLVLEKEFELSRDLISKLKVGDKIKIIVGVPENEKGQILLSLRKANEDYKWNLLENCLKTQEEIEVRGLDVNRGGMIARFMTIYGFIPASQFGRQWLGNLSNLYNKTFRVKVIEVDRSKNRLIFSEKAVSEAQAIAAQEEAVKMVKVGDILEGMVSGIMPFGIFVRVDISNGESTEKSKDTEKETKTNLFLEGLVHISEISWEKVDNINQLFKVGDRVKVKVLGVDSESSRLNLSIKQLQADPWTTIAEKYPPEKKFVGTVTKLAAFGAFVLLEKNIEGLVHISKIPADYQIKVGDKLDVYVEKVDLEHHRIALGLVLSKKPVGYK